MDAIELTALREPRPWRLRLASFLVRLASRVIGVPLVIRVESEPAAPVPTKMPKVSQYLEFEPPFEGYPRKWQRRAWLRRIMNTEDKE